MPGTFSPPPRVSDPDMHHGTCVTHVPWCMPVSLTSGFLSRRRRGKTFPAFPAQVQPAILRFWQEVHWGPCLISQLHSYSHQAWAVYHISLDVYTNHQALVRGSDISVTFYYVVPNKWHFTTIPLWVIANSKGQLQTVVLKRCCMFVGYVASHTIYEVANYTQLIHSEAKT